LTAPGLDYFREIWFVDFEYQQPTGENPNPICMVGLEWRSGRYLRLWGDDLSSLSESPIGTARDVLFVAYNASAELSCYAVLGWAFPLSVLDLYIEYRNLRSGLGNPPTGYGLLGCLSHFGLDGLDAAEKDSMRDLAMRGGLYSGLERVALMAYCQTDVDALARLLPYFLPVLGKNLAYPLARGRYMGAVARMQAVGVPIDLDRLGTLRGRWDEIQDGLIARVDRDYGVYDGRTFKVERFQSWLSRSGISWPYLDSGAIDLREQTFAEMAQAYPPVAGLHQLRVSLSQLRLNALEVGRDGRNRSSLFPFASKTSRNQPSNTRFIFGPAVWLRGLIRPEPDRAVAYVDWEQQEFGIAAALSGDHNMMDAYGSGDPYLAFGIQAGMIPAGATKATHEAERDLCKACILGTQYGMGYHSLARRIRSTPIVARELLQLHRETYSRFWEWSDAVERHAMLFGSLTTVFGWDCRVGTDANPRSLRNFPMQANGAEMLRRACSMATEAGIRVCAPVHDAIMIEAGTDDIEEVVLATQDHMVRASEDVLGGYRLRSDAKIIRYPGRYSDKRGVKMWDTIWSLLEHE
jgi:DNA polymerase-1